MMKRSLLFGVVVFLCFCTQVWGQNADSNGAYLGAGISYAIEDFDFPVRGTRSYDNTWGLNVKLGYDVKEWLSLEFNFDYLSEFTLKTSFSGPLPESDPPLTVPMSDKRDITVTTYMVVAKLFPLSDFKAMKPYLAAGGGLMRSDLDWTRSSLGVPLISGTYSETDPCATIGLGVDFFPRKNVSVGVEGSYVWGLNDLDDHRYFNLTSGVAYHF